MKKLSLDFGDKGLKGFAIDHVEKAALVVIALLAGYFMYEGATRETFQRGGPATMQKQAADALRNVTTDHTTEGPTRPEKLPEVGHLARVEVASKPTESGNYTFGLFNPPYFSPKTKRRDPKLFPVESLEVAGFRAAVYEITESADPYANDLLATIGKKAGPAPKAPPAEKTEKKKKDGGPNVAGPPKRKKTKQVATKDGDEKKPEVRAIGSVSPKYAWKYVDGFRPELATALEDVRGVTREFNVITGLLPYEKYLNEFEAILGNSDGFEPARDVPNFLMLRVERAEVGADPKAPVEWVRLSTKSLEKRFEDVWGGVTEEITDKKYIVNDKITFPIPPALMSSPEKLGLHSKIPRADFNKVAEERDAEMTGEATNETTEEIPETGGPMLPGQTKTRPGTSRLPKMTPPRPGMQAMPGMPGRILPGTNVKAPPQEKIKYKLVRFYDFETEPGKTYRYRVSVILEDPNRPKEREGVSTPVAQILDPAVVARLQKVDEKDATSGKPRTYYRESPVSEASPPVKAPTPIHFVMGSVRFTKTTKIPDPTTKAPTIVKLDEISGTLLPSIWVRSRATEAAGNADLPDDLARERDKRPAMYYGTMLNFTKDVNVLRPDTLQIHVISKAPFRTNAYVVDLRASETLPVGRTGTLGKLDTPSEILMVDHTGKLVIHNELDDSEDFHRLTFEGELTLPPTPPR